MSYTEKYKEYNDIRSKNNQKVLESFLQTSPDFKKFLDILALDLSLEKIDLLKKLAEENPDDQVVIFEYMKNFTNYNPGLTEKEEKIKYLNKLLGGPRNSFALYELSKLDILASNYDAAEEKLLTLVNGAEKDKAVALTKLGILEYNVKKNYKKCQEYFARLKESPSGRDCYQLIANIYIELCNRAVKKQKKKKKNNTFEKQYRDVVAEEKLLRLTMLPQSSFMAENFYQAWINIKESQSGKVITSLQEQYLNELIADRVHRRDYEFAKMVARAGIIYATKENKNGFILQLSNICGKAEDKTMSNYYFDLWLQAISNKDKEAKVEKNGIIRLIKQ